MEYMSGFGFANKLPKHQYIILYINLIFGEIKNVSVSLCSKRQVKYKNSNSRRMNKQIIEHIILTPKLNQVTENITINIINEPSQDKSLIYV